MLAISSKSVVVPAGRYVLGDPCYVVPDKDWGDLLASCNYFNQPVGSVGDFKVLSFVTKWGDGCYQDNNGNTYPVDAGMIGLVPFAYAETESDSVIVSFSEPTLCQDDDGILKFGSYVIDTVLVEDEE
jgi:hypothetical protein